MGGLSERGMYFRWYGSTSISSEAVRFECPGRSLKSELKWSAEVELHFFRMPQGGESCGMPSAARL